jgi:hypothetical protein
LEHVVSTPQVAFGHVVAGVQQTAFAFGHFWQTEESAPEGVHIPEQSL